MSDLMGALMNPDIPFLRNALLMGVAASFAFGVTGAYVVVRRISYLAGAIAHCVLAGAGASVYLNTAWGITWLTPMMGMLAVSLVAAWLIGFAHLSGNQREDTLIGMIWAVGMAVGLLLFSLSPGYVDPMSYLFGDILLVSGDQLVSVLILDALVIAVCVLGFPYFLAEAFDREFLQSRGISAQVVFMLLLSVIAITVVLLVSVVGILLAVALLTLPAATASLWSHRLSWIMVWSVTICILLTTTGISVSYIGNMPSGVSVILAAGLFHLSASCVNAIWRYIVRHRHKQPIPAAPSRQ